MTSIFWIYRLMVSQTEFDFIYLLNIFFKLIILLSLDT